MAYIVEHAFGEGAVGVEIGSHDLDVDGSGQAEVEDLGDDIDGKHVERHARILARQGDPQAVDVALRWGGDPG